MYIFNPALSETNHIPIDGDSPALLNFTATLSVADYHELKRNGGRVQLWSDILSEGASEPYSEWSSCDFELDATAVGVDSSAPEISSGLVDNPSPEIAVLTLQLLVPLSDNNQKCFSYTYRIQYPSGEVRWLGEFGQNGTLVCERSAPETALGLAAGWTHKAGIYMWTDCTNRTDIPLLRLANPHEYLAWTLGGENGEFFALFTTRRKSRPVSVPLEYILCASHTSVMHVQPEKTITVTGDGPLVMSSLPPRQSGLRLVKDMILQHCAPERVTINMIGEECLLVATRDMLPVQGIAITAPDLPHSTPLSIPTGTLRSLIPPQKTSTPFFLFAPYPSRVHLVTDVSKVSFMMNSGPFVLSPAFNITSTAYISILSLHKSAQVLEFAVSNLPTPPPSPEMAPRLIMPGHHSSSQLYETASSTPESVALPPVDGENKADDSVTRNSGNANDGIVKPSRSRHMQAVVVRIKCLLSITLFVVMLVLKFIIGKFTKQPAEHTEDTVAIASASALDQTHDSDSVGTNRADKSPHAGIVPSLDSANEKTSNINVTSKPDGLELDSPNSKVLLVEIGGGSTIKLAVREGETYGVVNAEMNGKPVLVSRTIGSAQAPTGTRVEFWELEIEVGGVLRISYDCGKTAC